MRRVFKTRHFVRWMRKTALTDGALCQAVREMVDGLVDADLGGDVVKKRVALPSRSWPANCCPSRGRNWPWPWKTAR